MEILCFLTFRHLSCCFVYVYFVCCVPSTASCCGAAGTSCSAASLTTCPPSWTSGWRRSLASRSWGGVSDGAPRLVVLPEPGLRRLPRPRRHPPAPLPAWPRPARHGGRALTQVCYTANSDHMITNHKPGFPRALEVCESM